MTSLDEELDELKIEEQLFSILEKVTPLVTEVKNGDGSVKYPTLYLLPKDLYEELLRLDTIVRGVYANRGLQNKNPFSTFAKIITPPKVLPSLVEVSYKYHIVIKHTYKFIKDHTKVASLLDSTYYPFEAAEKKRVGKLLKENNYSDNYIEEIKNNSNMLLKQTREQIDALLDDIDSYSLFLTDYTTFRYSAIIYHTLSSGKNVNTYLRNAIPNILYYEADEERSLSRGDKEVGDIIKTHACICGKIYFKKRV